MIKLKIIFFIVKNDTTKLLGINKIYSEVIKNTIGTYKGLTKIIKNDKGIQKLIDGNKYKGKYKDGLMNDKRKNIIFLMYNLKMKNKEKEKLFL